MAIDLSELVHIHDFEIETASLGRIQCGAYTMKAALGAELARQNERDREELTRALSEALSEAGPGNQEPANRP